MTDYSEYQVRTRQGKIITFGDKLGEGGQGAVYRARNSNYVVKVLNNEVALDWIKRCNARLIKARLWTRVPSLRSLPQDTFYIDGRLGHLSYYAFGDTLAHLIEEREFSPSQIELTKRLRMAYQLAIGVRLLHNKSIILADLCEENIIVDVRNGRLRLIDIDGLGIVGRYEPIIAKARSAWALELLHDNMRCADQQSDLWSLALLIHKLLIGSPPFPYPVAQTMADLWTKNPPISYPAKASHVNLLGLLGSSLANLFQRVFGYQRLGFLSGNRGHRPTALEWETALKDALKKIRKCSCCNNLFILLLADDKICPNCIGNK